MKKIGILTFHCAHNYGAVLQCYALQEYISQLGFYVEIIDYCPKYLIEPYSIFKFNRVLCLNPIKMAKNIIWEIILLYKRYKRHVGFDLFIKNALKRSNRVIDGKISNDYDIYIIGSDQVWNSEITNGYDKIYWGYFPFIKENRIYATYAASMESSNLNSKQIQFIKNALNNFDQISVRENKLVELLSPITKNKITQVIDPTLLVDISVWNKIIIKPNITQKYILVYQVRWNEHTIKIAKKLAKQINAEILELSAYVDRNCLANKYQTKSPGEFVGLIKHAECIITTSFHGTAFSIIYNKPFYTIKLNDNRDSRSTSILTALGLENRILSLTDNPIFENINYKNVNNILKGLKLQSQNYLDNILKI